MTTYLDCISYKRRIERAQAAHQPTGHLHFMYVQAVAKAMRKEIKDELKAKRPKLCEECGKNPADYPSRLCPGCEAYLEHQS